MQPYSYQYDPVGLSSQDGANVLSSIGNNNAATQDQTTTAAPTSQPNFLERLLPTAGAIGGGILGSFLDPFTFGMGTVGGAAGGSALGQQLENDLTGSKGSTLVAGAEGGIGQGAAMGATKLLGAGADALGGIGKVTDPDLATQEAAVYGPSMSAKQQLSRSAGDVLNNARSLGIDTLNPNNLVTASDQANKFYEPLKSSILNEAGPVDISGVDDAIKNGVTSQARLGDLSGLSKSKGTPSEAQGLYNTLTKLYQGNLPAVGSAEGGISTTTATPEAAQSFVKSVGNELAAAKADVQSSAGRSLNGVADPTLVAKQKALSQVYNNVKGELFGAPNVTNIVKSVTDMSPEEVAARVPGLDPNSPMASHLSDTVNNAQSYQDILNDHSMMTNIGKQGQTTNEFNQQNLGARANLAEGQNSIPPTNQGGSIPEGVHQVAGAIHPGLGVISRLVDGLSGTGARLGSNIIGSPAVLGGETGSIGSLGGRALTAAIPGGASVLSQLVAHAPSLGAPSPTSANIGTGSTAMNPYQTTPTPNPALGSNLILASLGGDTSLANTLGSQLQSAQKASVAAPLLNQAETAYNSAGGGQGIGNGFLSQLSSYIPGTAAYQYHQQMTQAAAAISQATGLPLAAVLSAMPSLMSNPSGAASEFGAAQSGLNNTMSPLTGLVPQQ